MPSYNFFRAGAPPESVLKAMRDMAGAGVREDTAESAASSNGSHPLAGYADEVLHAALHALLPDNLLLAPLAEVLPEPVAETLTEPGDAEAAEADDVVTEPKRRHKRKRNRNRNRGRQPQPGADNAQPKEPKIETEPLDPEGRELLEILFAHYVYGLDINDAHAIVEDEWERQAWEAFGLDGDMIFEDAEVEFGHLAGYDLTETITPESWDVKVGDYDGLPGYGKDRPSWPRTPLIPGGPEDDSSWPVFPVKISHVRDREPVAA